MKITVFQKDRVTPTVLGGVTEIETFSKHTEDHKNDVSTAKITNKMGHILKFDNVLEIKATKEDFKEKNTLDDFMQFLFEHLDKDKEVKDEDLKEFLDKMDMQDVIKATVLLSPFHS